MKPRRLLRHRIALLAAAVYNFVLFFPVLFMGRVVSPNDVFFNYDPWKILPHADIQSGLLNDPPTSYYTLMSLLEAGGAAFHWNPYVGSGIPGYGSSAAAVLSPLILLPVLLVPLTWVYTAILFFKLNLAFWLAYRWLREERLGKAGAALGAVVVAGAGALAVHWLWQSTNATVFYPALLLIVRRLFDGRRNSIALMTLVALAYALTGFPAAMAYGAYIAVAYALFLAIRGRRLPLARIGETIVAVALALLLAMPSLVPFVQLVRRTGYLDRRADLSLTAFFPPSHWKSFVFPERLGSPAFKNWIGDRALGMLNNFVESTVYLGLLTIPLALLALVNRRARARWFWLALLAIVLASMFGLAGVPRIIGHLPGFKYSTLARLTIVLPLPAGYLAAAGTGWLISLVARARRSGRRHVVLAWSLAGLLATVTAADLALFAGRFYPYLTPAEAQVPETPMIRFLHADRGPYRIAPFFLYFWPNSAELFRFEDVRSHFSSEAKYRELLARIDPTSWNGQSTVLRFNSLKFNFEDPLVGMLGIRYFIEQPSIDIVRWHIFSNTVPGLQELGFLPIPAGAVLQRSVRVDAEPFWAIELPLRVDHSFGRGAHVAVSLEKAGRVVWQRDFTPDEIAVLGKVYIPLRPYARAGETVVLRLRSVGIQGGGLKAPAPAGESPFFYGRVQTPVIFDRQLADGRVFRNLSEVPRFHVARRVRIMSDREFLAARDIDLGEEAVITQPRLIPPPDSAADAAVALLRYTPAKQTLRTHASGPLFLASSEKLTPELQVTVDGKPVKVSEINTLFAGLEVPAGEHEVVFSRRLARGWWWPAGIAAAIWLAIVVMELAAWRRRRLTSARPPG